MKQHTVPQLLLRNFKAEKKNQIYVFDKQRGISFKTAIENVACEKGFYNITTQGTSLSIEPSLSSIEDTASNIVKKIISKERLDILTEKEKSNLSLFLAIQRLRVRNFREQWHYLIGGTKETLKSKGYDPTAFPQLQDLTDDQIKEETILFLSKSVKDFAPHYLNKSWILYKAPKSSHFYISDNPITLQNTLNRDPLRGTIGLAVPGIEIHLPLSSHLCLALLCPSVEELMRSQAQKKYEVNLDTVQIAEFIKGFGGKIPIKLTGKNVINLNSLQVIYSSRFVYSSKSDFTLVKEMINENPYLRKGSMLQIE